MGYQKKRLAMRVITTIVVGLFALLFIFPFIWMLFCLCVHLTDLGSINTGRFLNHGVDISL